MPLFATPDDTALPQLGPFEIERWMAVAADAAFGGGNWAASTGQDATRPCAAPESPEWAALVASRIVADRASYEEQFGARYWKIEMFKTYHDSTGYTLVEARGAIEAALLRVRQVSTSV